MKKKFIAVFIAVWFSFLSAWANTCEQKDNLGRIDAELEFIIGMMDSSLFNGMYRLSLFSPYKNMTYDEQIFLKKAKESQKAAFAKKGLEWNETNIRSEKKKASEVFQKAVKDCESKQKKSVLD